MGAGGVRLNTVAPGAVGRRCCRPGSPTARYGNAIRDFISADPAPGAARGGRRDDRILAGPEAAFVHGAQFVVDGGIDAQARPTQF